MKYGLIAICDEDSDYANSLAAYFRIKGSLASEIIVFTEYDHFTHFEDIQNIDILIMQEDFLDSITNPSHGNLFILCENQTRYDYEDAHKIYKYNSAEEILRIIMANYDIHAGTQHFAFHKYKKSKIIGIASPIGRCGKTSFSLSLGLKLSQNNSCLFITFDECNFLRISLFRKEHISSSFADILYYFLQSMDAQDNRILSCFQSFQGMDYIPPSEELGTFSELTKEELRSFLVNIAALGKYDYIIIDWGNFSYDYSLINMCDTLLLPKIDNDLYSEEKYSHYFDSIKAQITDKKIVIKSISLPVIHYSSVATEYTLELTSSLLGLFCSNLIQELNL